MLRCRLNCPLTAKTQCSLNNTKRVNALASFLAAIEEEEEAIHFAKTINYLSLRPFSGRQCLQAAKHVVAEVICRDKTMTTLLWMVRTNFISAYAGKLARKPTLRDPISARSLGVRRLIDLPH